MITEKTIIVDGNPVLRKRAKKVDLPLSKEDQDLLQSMVDYVVNSKDEDLAKKYNLLPAVGIAAPQVGVSKQMCVVHVEDKDQIFHYALVNPVILSESSKKSALAGGEGCLSVKTDHPGYVFRANTIKVSAYDYLQGKEITIEAKGYLAIVIQHEIDHLRGILFYDHINTKDPWKQIANSIIIE